MTCLGRNRVESRPPALVVLCLALWAVACTGPTKPISGDAPRLEFVADLHIPTGTPFEEIGNPAAVPAETSEEANPAARKASTDFGGISAIAYDPVRRELHALSDSNQGHFFTLELTMEGASLRLRPLRSTRFSGVEPQSLDPEGFALTERGTFFVSSEGYPQHDPPAQPAILEFEATGQLIRQLPVPDRFLASSLPKTGVRNNLSFEGLTLSPDGARLFVVIEGPLIQDGPVCGVGGRCRVRILEYAIGAEAASPISEHACELDPTERPWTFGPSRGVKGLSDILALGRGELLALERGVVSDRLTNRLHYDIRLYWISLRGATDVSGLASLEDETAYRLAEKTLLLDLASVVPRFRSGFQSLDNFEAICFGPTLEDGSRSLLLMTDNNFRDEQRTALLLFRIAQDL